MEEIVREFIYITRIAGEEGYETATQIDMIWRVENADMQLSEKDILMWLYHQPDSSARSVPELLVVEDVELYISEMNDHLYIFKYSPLTIAELNYINDYLFEIVDDEEFD